MNHVQITKVKYSLLSKENNFFRIYDIMTRFRFFFFFKGEVHQCDILIYYNFYKKTKKLF